MICRSAFQWLQRYSCLYRGSLQLLEQPLHLFRGPAVSLCTAKRRFHSQSRCSNWRTPSADTNYTAVQRRFHCSPLSRGLEEFFPRTDNIIEEGEQTGKFTCSILSMDKRGDTFMQIMHTQLYLKNGNRAVCSLPYLLCSYVTDVHRYVCKRSIASWRGWEPTIYHDVKSMQYVERTEK